MKKEKIFKLLSFIFMILTFMGAGYVLLNHGERNAGFAVIPCLFYILFIQLSVSEKNKKK